MGHKLQANLHHLLLQMQASNKYDSICFMLQDLRHDVALGIQLKYNGICFNTIYDGAGNRTIDLAGAVWDLGDLCRKWPKAVNFDRYPVPCPGYTNPAEGYHATEDKWAGEYGLLRMELLDWLIQETAP